VDRPAEHRKAHITRIAYKKHIHTDYFPSSPCCLLQYLFLINTSHCFFVFFTHRRGPTKSTERELEYREWPLFIHLILTDYNLSLTSFLSLNHQNLTRSLLVNIIDRECRLHQAILPLLRRLHGISYISHQCLCSCLLRIVFSFS
jgi:hypothetical protein